MKRMLFLCTGNYYRSRFAEEYFNHHADLLGLPWQGDSRALARCLAATGNVGPISRYARCELERRGITMRAAGREPIRAEPHDLVSADHIIALSRHEHEPMVREHFAEFASRIRYYEIGDVGVAEPGTALSRLVQCLDLELSMLCTESIASRKSLKSS